jgi:hypothetical protein
MDLTIEKALKMKSQLFETLVNHNHPKTEVGLTGYVSCLVGVQTNLDTKFQGWKENCIFP